jgi:uncharacterized protein YbjT (DUF2867 family)
MIVVIGATGNVGRHVLARLRATGADVRALVRPGAAHRVDGVDGVHVVTGSLDEPGGLDAALAGAGTVFLVWPFLTTDGAPSVVEAIARHARRVVYLSSIGVGGPEERADPIFALHAGMERLIAVGGVAHTVLRADTIASNALGWAEQIRTTGVVRGPLTAPTAVVDPRDIAAVAARVLTDDAHAGTTYRLTGPEVIGRPEQVAAIGAAIGRELRFEEVPVPQARARMLADGRAPALVDALLSAAENRSASTLVTSTVEDLTGTPSRSFAEWARDHREAFR